MDSAINPSLQPTTIAPPTGADSPPKTAALGAAVPGPMSPGGAAALTVPAPPAGTPAESPPKSTKRRLKRSVVWQHFVEVESDKNTAICNHCSRGINRGRNARNTTNLHQHLRTRHPELNIPPLASFPRKRKSAPAAGDTADYLTAAAAAFGGRGGSAGGASAAAAAVPLACFLAEAGLPLSAVEGPALRRLAAAWGVHGALPNAAAMRASGVPSAVEATQVALRNAIAPASVSVIVGDVVNGVRIVRCSALTPRFERVAFALAVFEEGERDTGLLIPRDRSASSFGAGWNIDRLSPMLKGRISTLIAKYQMLEKLQCVVIPEHAGQFEVLTFHAPREEQQTQQPQLHSDQAVFHRHPVQEFMDEAGRVNQEHNVPVSDQLASDTVPVQGMGGAREIPVVPCLVSLIESIFDAHVLSNNWVESSVMGPVRLALHPNSPRRNVKKEKKMKRSFDEMGAMNQSFDNDAVGMNFNKKDMEAGDDSQARIVKAKELLGGFQKRFASVGAGRTVDSIDGNAVNELHKALLVFDEACGLLMSGPKPQDGSPPPTDACSPVSVAIPVLRSVSRALEENSKEYTGELNELTKRVLGAINRTQRELEGQEMYAVATILDPRFKGRSFSSEETARFAESIVLNACRQLERNRENDPDSNAQTGFVPPAPPKASTGSMLGQFMDEVVHDKLDSSSSVTAYLAEPVFPFNEDVYKYWQRNASRWPDLTAVAAKYLCVPACARRTSEDSSLTTKLQFDQQDKGSMLFLRLNTALEV